MSLTDCKGVSWARSSTIKPGDRVKCDGGFTCMNEGDIKTVRSKQIAVIPPFDSLYIECRDGKHMLEAQLSFEGDGALVGLYPA